MQNNSLKSIQSDLPVLNATENLKENYDDEYEYDENDKRPGNTGSIDSSFEFVTPSESLVEKIIQRVEFLFSDGNVVKDKFLRKHLGRNKEGYVSLKLISSLRKVRTLSRDWRVIAYSLQKSEKLKMNAEMTKIRRTVPLPQPEVQQDEPRPVLVFYHMIAYWTLENMKKLLRKMGTVASLVMIKSEADVMNPSVKKTLDLHKNIASFPFAVVKFGTARESANAIRRTSKPATPLKIVPLVEDENEAYPETAIQPVRERKRHPVKNKDSAMNSERNEMHQTCLLPRVNAKCESCFRFSHIGDGPGNGGCNQRQNRIGKDKLESPKKPYVVVLRPPKGPDETGGFRKRLAIQPK